MIRKNLSLVVLAILVALAGAACKKDSPDSADNKGYIVDPNSGTTPQAPTKPGTDPCLKKGAIGVQALLTKADCGKLNEPVCGNKVTESGEACDGQPKCGKDCKWATADGGQPGSKGDGVVSIKTTSLDKVAYQKEKYSTTIDAACKPAPCNFALKAGTTLPKSFSLSNSGKLSSDNVTAELGEYPLGILVQNKDGSQSASQDLKLLIHKHLKIRLFVEGFSGFEVEDKSDDHVLDSSDYSNEYPDEAQAFVPISQSGVLTIGPSHDSDTSSCTGVPSEDSASQTCRPEFGWFVVGVDFLDPVDNDLSAEPGVDVAANYTWSVKTGDGKDLSSLGVEVGDAYNSKLGKKVKYMIFVSPKGNYSNFYSDQKFKDVKITVADGKGNTSDLTIKELVFLAPLKTEFVIKQEKKTAEANDPCNKMAVKFDKVTIDDAETKEFSKPLDVTLDSLVKVTFTIEGGYKPVPKVTSDVFEKDKATMGLEYGGEYSPYTWNSTNTPSTPQSKHDYERTFRYGKKSLSSAGINDAWSMPDTMTVTVTDPKCPGKSKDATLKFNVKYPEVGTASLGDKIAVTATIGASDTNNDILTLSINGEGDKYFYVYLNNNNGWQLNDVGDKAPDSCFLYTSYGVSQKCPVSGTLNIYTAGDKANSDMKKAYLHANATSISTDSTSDLDVWIHTIKVQGKYWEAEYGDGADSFTKEKPNITEDDGDSYPWSADGPLPWKRRAVPDYDGK